MIILDTNVISEMMRTEPNAAAFRWLEAQPLETLWTTAVSEAEIRIGVAILPAGRRRTTMAADAEAIFEADLGGRVLPFDRVAATFIGQVFADRRQKGRPISMADAQIVAIALAHGAKVATRDTHDLADCGVDVIDPWTADDAAGP